MLGKMTSTNKFVEWKIEAVNKSPISCSCFYVGQAGHFLHWRLEEHKRSLIGRMPSKIMKFYSYKKEKWVLWSRHVILVTVAAACKPAFNYPSCRRTVTLELLLLECMCALCCLCMLAYKDVKVFFFLFYQSVFGISVDSQCLCCPFHLYCISVFLCLILQS